jgi:hypothetical protein
MSSQQTPKVTKDVKDIKDADDDDVINKKQEILNEIIKIMERLRIISTLEGGYKLWITIDDKGDKILSIDNSYFVPQFISRYMYSQNRNDIVNMIIDDTNYINEHYSNLGTDKIRKALSTRISNAIKGLKIVKETYKNTPVYAEKLDSVIGQLEKYVLN